VIKPTIYVVMRRDLAMRRGKEIAQACHAVLGLGAPDNGPLIGLQVVTKDELLLLVQEAIDAGVGHYMVYDAGHTEIPRGTLTCVAIGPVEKGRLPLLSAARLY
jgi:PTH2 family peptidyl-tRNA hydrolase